MNKFEKGSILEEEMHKATSFHMTTFLHSLLYLIHCKHFVDIFSPISAFVTSRNAIFVILITITEL